MDDGTGQYAISLCNAIGAPVQIKYTEIEPLFACMTTTHIIVTSTQDVCVVVVVVVVVVLVVVVAVVVVVLVALPVVMR